MSVSLSILLYLKGAFDVLSTNGKAIEKNLNYALYNCMYPHHGPVLKNITNYYAHYVPANLPLEIRQKKVRKKTIDLLDALLKYGYRDLPDFDERRYFEINQILKLGYLPRERFMANSRKVDGFNFDVYRLTKSVSQLSEMDEIEGYTTKYILLEWYLVKFISDVFEGIYAALNEVNLIEGENRFLMLPNEYVKMMARVKSICFGEEPKMKVVECADKRGLLKDYCKVYPTKETNLNRMVEFLEDLKGRMKINPHECNKKTFAAVTYILYRSQSSIGMKPKSFKTFSKFKKLMSLYYDMPENSFKENDIRELALEIKYSYPCFNSIKFDE